MKRFVACLVVLCMCLGIVFVLVGCRQTKEVGEISNIQDLSKIFDGTPVSRPTYVSNNTDGEVTITFYKRNSETPISAPSEVGQYTVKVSIAEGSKAKAVEGSKDFVIFAAETNFEVTFVEGTEDCYTITESSNGEQTLTFTAVSAKSVYSVTGVLMGNVVIDCGDDYKFELEMSGFIVSSNIASPIEILSGDKVTLTGKSETSNYVYDKRDAVTDETEHSSCIYSVVDTVIGGKGSLTVISDNNNGIHTKDDLEVKNVTLA